MGSQSVKIPKNKREMQDFVKRVLRDTKALERMLEEEMFEVDTIRIGAEQEFNLIDKHFRPAPINMEMLKAVNDENFTTELARFNMETNVPPLEFKGNCLSAMEKNIVAMLKKARKYAAKFNAEVILTGILPTLRKFDLEDHNLTPLARYRALCDAIIKMKGDSSLELKIRGIDELITRHDSPLLEACNTGFQVHLQIKPDEFPSRYNIAQAVCGPAMACATYSPMLFGKRLWHETRIALFQQSVDTRTSGHHLRDNSPRVMFGNDWVKKSIVEIYKEDIMRFKVLLSSLNKEDSLKMLEKGKIPNLDALLVHNSTVYRWNRPCYGNAGNIPHLRIENRVLPAGPTVVDEMANAALWLGLLNGGPDYYKDITKELDFDAAKSNFLTACREGLDSGFTWRKRKKISARELIQKELIPIAREGLKKAKVHKRDIDKYLNIIKQRTAKHQTGSQWMLNSYSALIKETNKREAILSITASALKHQRTEKPVHTWPLADLKSLAGSEMTALSVEEFMSMDLITVTKDDIIELASEIMDAQKVRYVPVENDKGNLVGLVTSRTMLRYLGDRNIWGNKKTTRVGEIMIKNPLTVGPDSLISDAVEIMQKNGIGCLPVVKNKLLLGVITEQDFLTIASRLLRHSGK